MDPLHQEGGQGATLGLLIGSGAEDGDTVDGLKPIEKMAGELGFPGLDRLEADRLEVEWGKAIDPAAVEDRLRTGRYDAVSVAHNETSTAVRNPLEELAEVMREASICGLGQAASMPLTSAMRYWPKEFGLS